jgi:hypothetical protein
MEPNPALPVAAGKKPIVMELEPGNTIGVLVDFLLINRFAMVLTKVRNFCR